MAKLSIVTIGDTQASRVASGSMADLFMLRARARAATTIFTVGTAANAPARLAAITPPAGGFSQVDFIGHGIHARSGDTYFAFTSMQRMFAGRGMGPDFVAALCWKVGGTEALSTGFVSALANLVTAAVEVYFEACEIAADQAALVSLGSQLRFHGKSGSISGYTTQISWSPRAPHEPVIPQGSNGRLISVNI